jgi:hypothetical protein
LRAAGSRVLKRIPGYPLFIRQRGRCRRNGGPISPVSVKEGAKPWQDRRMLFRFADWPQTACARRLAHGPRRIAKTMKDDRNV